LDLATAGHDVVMSPTSHCYFDYAQSWKPGEPDWVGGFIPLQTVYAFEPIPAGLAAENRAHILGGQGNVWTESLVTPSEVEYFAFPRAAALAEVLWSPVEAREYKDFCRRASETPRPAEG
jgi:hexosaminidase